MNSANQDDQRSVGESRSQEALDSATDEVSDRGSSPEFSVQDQSDSPEIDSLPQARQDTNEKWNRLRRFYSDEYVEISREEFEEGYDNGVSQTQLEDTQVGAVTWYVAEKDRLYSALSRKGRNEIRFIAQAIGTKSEIEVRDYLLLLREKEAGRHLFSAQTKTISHADIPAAVEISTECEEAVERAADAQVAYQERYDLLLGMQRNDGMWVIDHGVAQTIDEKTDKREELLLDDILTEADPDPQILFYLSTFIELSERVFMNQGGDKLQEDWKNFAMECESPGLTKEVVSDLYNLVVSITRRLMQTSLFLAQSRQRATSDKHYQRQSTVKETDVLAALQVLKMKGDLWEYWITVPRRNKLDIVNDSHHKGGCGSTTTLSYELVEQKLSKRFKRWRGRRRSSSASTDAISTEDEAIEPYVLADLPSAASEDSITTQSDISEDDHDPRFDAESGMRGTDIEESASATDEEGSESDEFGGLSFHAATPRQKRRHIYLEHQQDEYLEALDAQCSRKEEARLWAVLGQEAPVNIENEKESGPGVRPKVLRKAAEDLQDFLSAGAYQAEWERYGRVVPAGNFEETENNRARKRRKTTRSLRDETGERLPNPRSHAAAASTTRNISIRSRSMTAEQEYVAGSTSPIKTSLDLTKTVHRPKMTQD